MADQSFLRTLLRRIQLPLLILFALLALVGLYILYAFFWPNAFHGVAEKPFYVSRGQTFAQVVDSLVAQGIVRDRGLFAVVSNLHGGTTRVQVGKYIFRSGISNNDIFLSLRSGKGTVLIPVTIREGLTIRRQARVFGRLLGIDTTKYIRLANDTSFSRSLGFAGEPLEGYLFPDTYSFAWQLDEHDIIKRLVEQFKRMYTDSLKQRADQLGLSMRQVVTMASIVEGETHLEEERPVVAGVYYNRLRHKMRLQADPTIQYLLESGPRRLFYSDLRLDSPYNTYTHAGMPPGPVNNPGIASIRAALFPATHRYLYFVANGSGGHWFSATYDAHMKNVRKVRKQRAMAENNVQNGGKDNAAPARK